MKKHAVEDSTYKVPKPYVLGKQETWSLHVEIHRWNSATSLLSRFSCLDSKQILLLCLKQEPGVDLIALY